MTTNTEGSTNLPDSERQKTYTVRETAAVMGLSLGVTYELLRQGRLPGLRLGKRERSWPRSRGVKTRGLYVDPAGSQLRFRELADRWWAAREVELTTAAANRSRLDNHVLPCGAPGRSAALNTWTCKPG